MIRLRTMNPRRRHWRVNVLVARHRKHVLAREAMIREELKYMLSPHAGVDRQDRSN